MYNLAKLHSVTAQAPDNLLINGISTFIGFVSIGGETYKIDQKQLKKLLGIEDSPKKSVRTVTVSAEWLNEISRLANSIHYRPGIQGIIPPSVQNYENIDRLKGSIDAAKALL